MQIHGEKGWAALDPAYAYNEERRFFGKVGGKWFERNFKIVDEFSLELDHLAACIRADRDPLPDGNAGLRDAMIMEAIYEASKQGQAVAIRVQEKFNSQPA